jgi:hypothetical protein
MTNRIRCFALAALVGTVLPTALLAGDPAPAQQSAVPTAPKKKSSLLSFAKRVAEQVAPQVLPQDGSLKAVAGQVALSAVQQADAGDASASAPANACGLDAASVAAMSMPGEGGSAAPNPQARAALRSMAAMMKSRGDRATTAAANAMLGGKSTC